MSGNNGTIKTTGTARELVNYDYFYTTAKPVQNIVHYCKLLVYSPDTL